jgi:hypothetical protein
MLRSVWHCRSTQQLLGTRSDSTTSFSDIYDNKSMLVENVVQCSHSIIQVP